MELQTSHSQETQPWYNNNEESRGSFQNIQIYLDDLMVRVPSRKYFLDPTKTLLVVSKNKVLWFQALFRGMGLRVMTSRKYIGGFIYDREANTYNLRYNMIIWKGVV